MNCTVQGFAALATKTTEIEVGSNLTSLYVPDRKWLGPIRIRLLVK